MLLQVTDHICKLQEYVNGMARLQLDEHEYAYLKAVTLFSAGEVEVVEEVFINKLEFLAQIPSLPKSKMTIH
jgi:hypothetical protein